MNTYSKPLHGRAREIDMILEAYKNTREGSPQAVLLCGESGSGKTATVSTALCDQDASTFYLLQCKSDQYNESKAYSAIGQLIDPLVQELFTLPKTTNNEISRQLRKSIGTNLLVLQSIHPDVVHLLDDTCEHSELPVKESEHRIYYTLSAFLDVILSIFEFFIFFIDDIQWIDKKSIDFLSGYLKNGASKNKIFLIGTLRKSEAPIETLETLSQFKIPLKELPIYGLKKNEISNWIKSRFQNFSTSENLKLTDLLKQLTNGNPLFIENVLNELEDNTNNGINIFENFNQIVKLIVSTDDTIQDLIVAQITRLSKQTQYALGAAACLHHEFPQSTISMFCQLPEQSSECINEAMKAGMITYSTRQTKNDTTYSNERYIFSHDTIQQSARLRLSPDEQARVHFNYGRQLLSFELSNSLNADSFVQLDSLNRLKSHENLANQRLFLSRLNTKAAITMHSKSANIEACRYAKTALEISNDSWWENHHDHMMVTHTLASKLELGLGNPDAACEIANAALPFASNRKSKTELYDIKMTCETAKAEYEDAIGTARTALSLWNIKLPLEDTENATALELQVANRDCTPSALSDLKFNTPKIPIGELRSLMSLLANLLAPTDAVAPAVNNWLGIKMVNITLTMGYVPESAKAIVNYGCTIGAMGKTTLGYAMGKRAMTLSRSDPNPIIKNRVEFSFLTYLKHWRSPISEISEECENLRQECIKNGDLLYAGFLYGMSGSLIRIFTGQDIEKTRAYLVDARLFCKANENTSSELLCISTLMCIDNLRGITTNASDFRHDDLDETLHLRACDSSGNMMAIALLRVLQALVFLIAGDIKQAFMSIESAAKNAGCLYATYTTAVYSFLRAVILIRYTAEKPTSNTRLRPVILENLNKLKEWSDEYPHNFLAFYTFVCAEDCVAQNNMDTALIHYEESLMSASDASNHWLLGMIHERIAEFWKTKNSTYYFQVHIVDALKYYQLWGASLKAESLYKTHESTFTTCKKNKQITTVENHDAPVKKDSTSHISQATNILTTLSNDSRIVRELVLNIIQLFSATYACVLSEDEGSLSILATASSDGFDQHKIDSELDEAASLCPISVIRTVKIKQQPFYASVKTLTQPYSNDSYFLGGTKTDISFYCIPVSLFGSFEGIIYLEMNDNINNIDNIFLISENIIQQLLMYLRLSKTLRNTDLEVKSRTAKLSELHFNLRERYVNLLHKTRQLAKLRQFVHPNVTCLIDQSKKELLKPHRKEVAILFCDLRGFTEYSENLESEEAVALLKNYHETLGRIIKKNGGTTDHIAGDGLMLFVGDPVNTTNSVDVALTIAMEMRIRVNELLDEQKKRDRNIGFGIGISFGYATIGLTGFYGSRSYSATGRYVNLASRLCDAAKHSEILISMPALAELNEIQVRGEYSTIRLKGLPKSTKIFKVHTLECVTAY